MFILVSLLLHYNYIAACKYECRNKEDIDVDLREVSHLSALNIETSQTGIPSANEDVTIETSQTEIPSAK